jgi:ubiquinone biosynthesis protein
MVREFAGGVLKELDYQNEAYHALRIAEAMQVFPEIHIPVVDPSRSTARVLTAEYVEGIKISDTERLAASGVDTHRLGEVFIRAMIKQVLVDGFFHGDPHPGNIFVDPLTQRIIFLDFGLVGELRTDQRTTLIQLLLGLRAKDSTAIADALIGLGQPGPNWDERSFRHDIDRVVRQHLVYSKVDSIGEGIGSVLGAVVDNGLRLDTDLTLAIKAVVQAEETARALSVNVDIAAAAFDQARAAIFERLRGDAVEKFLSGQAIRVGQELLRRLPELETAAWSWLDQFGKGRLVVTIDTSDLNKQIGKVSDLGRQVAIGMLVTGQLIGTAILAAVLLQPTVSTEFQTFGYVGLITFGISLIVSMYVLFRQIRATGDSDT